MKQARALSLCVLVALTACGTEKPPYPGLKIGKPYEVSGHWYTPEYESHYDKTGLASWYGPGFHGSMAASGEQYDQYAMTAAHKTLPLYSLVRVTNLDNGRSTIVKINDRGPFVSGRIIDLSRAAAEKLGVVKTGTAKVRVQFLDEQTRQYAMSHVRGTASDPYLAANSGYSRPTPVPEQQPPVVIAESTSKEDYFPEGNVFALVDEADATETKEKAPVAKQVVAAPAAHGYAVQVGTFAVRENAEKLQQNLASMGIASVQPVTVHNKSLYRVVMGPYSSQGEAKNLLSQLVAQNVSGAHIIQY